MCFLEGLHALKAPAENTHTHNQFTICTYIPPSIHGSWVVYQKRCFHKSPVRCVLFPPSYMQINLNMRAVKWLVNSHNPRQNPCKPLSGLPSSADRAFELSCWPWCKSCTQTIVSLVMEVLVGEGHAGRQQRQAHHKAPAPLTARCSRIPLHWNQRCLSHLIPLAQAQPPASQLFFKEI